MKKLQVLIALLVAALLILGSFIPPYPIQFASSSFTSKTYFFPLEPDGTYTVTINNVSKSSMGLMVRIAPKNPDLILLNDNTTRDSFLVDVEYCFYVKYENQRWSFLYNQNFTDVYNGSLTITIKSIYKEKLDISLKISDLSHLSNYQSEIVNFNMQSRVHLTAGLLDPEGCYDCGQADSYDWLAAEANLTLWIKNKSNVTLDLMINSLELNNSLKQPYDWHYDISISPHTLTSFNVVFPSRESFANDTFWGGRIYLNYLNSTNSTAIENGDVMIQVLDVINFVGYRHQDYMDPESAAIIGILTLIYYLASVAGWAIIVLLVSFIIYLVYRKRKRRAIILDEERL